jgi:CheY-like chemotaxis protein
MRHKRCETGGANAYVNPGIELLRHDAFRARGECVRARGAERTRMGSNGAKVGSPYPPGFGRRILLVEDDPHVAETLSELLRLDGYRVSVAKDAASGLQLLRREPADLVLCDLSLPGEMDGFGFAGACRADSRLRRLRLMAVSGYCRAEDRRRAVAAGFDGLIGKPIDLERVHAVFAQAGTPAV